MLPNPSIFRAYDIRGIYPEEINEKIAYQIGKTLSIYLKEFETPPPDKMVVGEDARLSSPILARSFIKGATDEGLNIWDIGLTTVDEIYFASGYFHAPAAMITASHNSKEWNGFKLMKSNVNFFDVSELKEIISSDAVKNNISKEKGGVIQKNIRDYYVKHILNFTNPELVRPMRVAIDASNGSVGPALKLVLEKLPVDYTAINFNPDGNFPYHDPDPTKEKNLADLINKVKLGHYHFGCAFDGDGDRIIFIDENGDPISPSIITALISKYFLSKSRGEKVVYDTTMSKMVPEIIRTYNGEAVREKVGHAFINRRLKEIKGILGAENSGHYFFRDNFYADSGIIGFLMLLNILSGEKKSLSVLAREFSKYASTPVINFKVSNSSDAMKKIAQNFEGYEIDWLDGLTVTTTDFWFNFRPSNTEPLLRLTIEAKDELTLARVKKDLTSLIKSLS